MDYMTAAEAAEKWGVTIRQVQRLLAANRIEGAIKYQRLYLVPADAAKPADPRFEKKQPQYSLSDDLDEVIAATALPLPCDDPDAILEIVCNEPARLQKEGYLAYLRGDFKRAIQCFRKIGDNDAAKLRSCSLAVGAAISTGDYPLFTEIESYCKGFILADMGAKVTAVAEWALATAYTSAFAPAMVPNWLKDGDYSALPQGLRPEALYKRARYLHFLKEYGSVLDIAQTALALDEPEHGLSYMNVYLRLMCAAAYCSRGRLDDAEVYLLDVMKDCLPHGFITPFAEHAPLFGGLLEQLLEQKYPKHYDAVTGQSARTIKNWLSFHNRFTMDNITTILNPKEYQMSLAVARGESNRAIAAQFHYSERTLETKLRIIYDKLLIEKGGSRRKELVKYIL